MTMDSKFLPEEIGGKSNSVSDLSQRDFITMLMNESPPLPVVRSMEAFVNSLPEDVSQKASSLVAGWKIDIATKEVTSFVTLEGKNSEDSTD